MGELIKGKFGQPRPTEEKGIASELRVPLTGVEDGKRLIRISEELAPKRDTVSKMVSGIFSGAMFSEQRARLRAQKISNADLVALMLRASEREVKTNPAYYAAVCALMRERWDEIVDDQTIFDVVGRS